MKLLKRMPWARRPVPVLKVPAGTAVRRERIARDARIEAAARAAVAKLEAARLRRKGGRRGDR